MAPPRSLSPFRRAHRMLRICRDVRTANLAMANLPRYRREARVSRSRRHGTMWHSPRPVSRHQMLRRRYMHSLRKMRGRRPLNRHQLLRYRNGASLREIRRHRPRQWIQPLKASRTPLPSRTDSRGLLRRLSSSLQRKQFSNRWLCQFALLLCRALLLFRARKLELKR